VAGEGEEWYARLIGLVSYASHTGTLRQAAVACWYEKRSQTSAAQVVPLKGTYLERLADVVIIDLATLERRVLVLPDPQTVGQQEKFQRFYQVEVCPNLLQQRD
jgi:hypothetical protein